MHPLIERLFQFILPSQCPCCETYLEEGRKGICPDCFSKIRWIAPPFCSICGMPFVSTEVENHPCGACVKKTKYFTMARALGYYEGPLQETIHRWKYEGKSSLSPIFGEWMAEKFPHYWDPKGFDLILPVPLHIRRLRERGFNQALLLAKELSRRTGIPCRMRVLQKKVPTLPQVQLSGAEREKGVRGSFHILRGEELEGKTVLLVDDVYTTGATVNECSKVLLAAGTARVDIFTLAHAIKIT